ncbi:hypothetical protein AB0D14_40315 [Streptomyces sp. NPDC048484]|uniref:hypothetical protein n=1 Tax=Streptomyces sp. NPDC048484 TaxID=3155146 RepID=UPI003418E5B1
MGKWREHTKVRSEVPTEDAITSARNFVGEFNRLRKHAGNPSYIVLAKQVPGLPKSTIHEALSGSRKSLADWPLFQPLIRLCIGIAKDHGISDAGSEDEWRQFWKDAIDELITLSPLASAAAREKARKAEQRAHILEESGVLKTLRAIYPNYPPVDLWGVAHPICEFPALVNEWDDAESAVGRLLDRKVPADDYYSTEFDQSGGKDSFFNYVARFRSASEGERRRFFPGAAYAFDHLWFDKQEGASIDCVMGRYFTSLATSEDLDTEMMEGLAANPTAAVQLSELPRRSWLHQQVEDPIVDGRHRAAAVSHATVVMIATSEGGYDLILPVRSRDVATHANFNHVAPSGIFAPYDESFPSPIEEFSIRRNFYREWVEELYAAEEHEHPPYAVVLPDPEDEPEITRLKDLFRNGIGRLNYTGISVNLLTLRPEICMALIVEDSKWLAEEARIARETGRPFKLGWEYEPTVWQGPKVSGKPGGLRMRLDADLRPVDGSILRPSFLIPNAAAAISLAIRMLKIQRSRLNI